MRLVVNKYRNCLFCFFKKHDGFGPLKDFTAFRSDDYGYTRMTAFNASHLYFEQVSDEQDGKIIDMVWVIKDKHGPYMPGK